MATTMASTMASTIVSSYGGFANLPVTYTVVLPGSCCSAGSTITAIGTSTYCLSSFSGLVNHFYTTGCVRSIDTVAGNQAMGFGVINSFLVVLAFVAIPLMFRSPSARV
ncbi:unnamed protein product [Adineta steineri]|nr:unnamed protein product [Adineta steineri]